MALRFRQSERHRQMLLIGKRDDKQVDIVAGDHRVKIGRRFRNGPVFGECFRALTRSRVVDHDLLPVYIRQTLHIELSDKPGAEHRDADRITHKDVSSWYGTLRKSAPVAHPHWCSRRTDDLGAAL